MKPGIIVAARMGSTRLPGKATARLGGSTVLGLCLERCLETGLRVILATTVLAEDDALLAVADATGDRVTVYRGESADVLARVVGAAERYGIDPVVRVTGDCPFAEPAIINGVLDLWLRTGAVMATNIWPARTFARGLDVEIVSLAGLEWLRDLGPTPEEREHVTLGLYRRLDATDIASFGNSGRWRGPEAPQLCVDTPEDLARLGRWAEVGADG